MIGVFNTPLIKRAGKNPERRAIITSEGVFTYQDLLITSSKVASCLLDGADDLQETRVAFLTPPGFQYVALQWGIWRAGGTAGKPKGVVTTHKNIEVQVKSLISAWEWTPKDHILNILPLNHIHGIINVLTCALWAGATCEILPKFDAEEVWALILKGDLTLFMAVPTIYVKLIASWEATSPRRQKALSAACSRMRLMVSGSAALPVSVIEAWKTISGHVLLERYGMTEIGMALSNPLHGQRVPGYVGTPLPNIKVRLVDEKGKSVKPESPGEIQVKGPGVFLEYWRKPDMTKNAFREGWFSTGDIAVIENGIYRILGRSSVDIIKTGGYKASALEIEDVLRTYPDIKDCAVVGLEDLEWGERVGAAIVLKDGSDLTLDSLRKWAKERLAVYKIPTQILVINDLPRNEMGKISKPEVAQLFKDKKGTNVSCPIVPKDRHNRDFLIN